MFAFRAMNTDVTVTSESGDEDKIARDVAALFWRAERRFSRFREDSELSRLNRARGPMVVSRELFAALLRARTYAEMSEGVFDAGIGAALIAAGYDRSFAPGGLDRDEGQRLPANAGGFRDVQLNARMRTVNRPDHIQIDLGGMIKGATVDAATAMLPGAGAIDAGVPLSQRPTPVPGVEGLSALNIDPEKQIEPYAWIINSSVAAAGSGDPCLKQRVAGELEQIEIVRARHAQRSAIVPWMTEEPVGPERLLVLAGRRDSDSRERGMEHAGSLES